MPVIEAQKQVRAVEAQPPRGNKIIRLVDRIAKRGDTPLRRKNTVSLDKVHTGTQKTAQVDSEGFPMKPPRIEVDGKSFTGIEYFYYLIEQHERAKQEAEARGEVYVPPIFSMVSGSGRTVGEELEELDRKIFAPIAISQRIRADLVPQMAKEAEDTQFDRMAEIIQEKIWKHKTPVSIRPVRHVALHPKDDDTYINRSRFGVSISYSHEDKVFNRRDFRTQSVWKEEELSFGIGYFTERGYLVPEMRDEVTDEQLQKGVKSYFITRSYSVPSGIRGSAFTWTEVFAIPFDHKDTNITFFDYLYDSAKLISPQWILPQAQERVKKFQSHRVAA